MRFTKMHGQGNDFVMISAEEAAGKNLPELSIAVCDRNRGVGGDGLIAVLPSITCDFMMRIFNPDGTEPEMCGNGVRCAAKFFLDRTPPPDIASRVKDGKVEITVETLAGTRGIVAEYSGGVTGSMSVDMGAPILKPADIPVKSDGENAVGIHLQVAGSDVTVTCVSMGNPHCVVFTDKNPFEMDISALGPALEKHEAFPKKANVEFVQVLSADELRMRVWERGVGETLACGTGACATLVASHLNGKAGKSAVVHLSGGDLKIDWRDSGEIIMTGPAVIVFDGEFII